MRSISRQVMWGVSKANSKATDRFATRFLSITREDLQKYGGLDESDRVAMIIQHSSSASVVEPGVFEHFDPSLARGVVELRQDISTVLTSKKQREQKQKLSPGAISALTEADTATSKWLGQFYAHDQVELRPINFAASSTATIEAVVDREKVLSSVTIDNLKSRLSNGRYLYGLFHKDIPEDPLVFVHIVLTNEFSGSIDAVEHNVEVKDPQYGMFYSISSSYTALKNIGLPQLLLKRAKEMLQDTIPSIHTYSTLSPIPGFMNWLMSPDANKVALPSFVPETILRSLGETSDAQDTTDTDALQLLRDTLGRSPSRMLDPVFAEQIKPSLQWLCAYYLSQTTRTMAGGKVIPLDDVANFHLRNGASLYRLNYHADLSPAALGRSAGMMVNYLYTSKVHQPLQNVPGYSMPVGPSIVDILRK